MVLISTLAILVFSMMSWLFTFTVAGFDLTPAGVIGSAATLIVFWIGAELIARLKDGPLFDVFEYLISEWKELGTLFSILLIWTAISVMVALTIWTVGTNFPQAFTKATDAREALRLGFSITLVFGFLHLIKFPIRPTTILEQFGLLKGRRKNR